MRYIGVDYGRKKIGLALSDSEGTMGFPHSVVQNTPRVIDEVCALINKEGVGSIVIGESLNLDGKDNSIACEARAFGESLSARTQIPLYFESEVFTSAEARRMPGKDVKSRAPKKRADVDASAAAIILTSFLSRAKHE